MYIIMQIQLHNSTINCFTFVCANDHMQACNLKHHVIITYCSSKVKANEEGTGRLISNCITKPLHYYPPVVYYHQLKQCHCKIHTYTIYACIYIHIHVRTYLICTYVRMYIRYSSKVTSHSTLVVYSHSTQALLECSGLDPESCFTTDLQQKLL